MIEGSMMAANVIANPGHSNYGWMQRFLLAAAVAIIVLFVFWLIADQEIVAWNAAEDHLWFIQKAKCWYWFDDGYSNMSFIKEPVYPLFIAVCYRLGLPLRLMTEAVYLAAAGFLAYCLVVRQSRAWVGLVVFAACALHPMHVAVFEQSRYDTIYTCLLLLALGAVLLQLKRGDEPGRWRRRLGTGLALALLYNTRPERPWVLLLIAGFLATAAVRAWRRQTTLGTRLRAWAAECIPPVAVVAALTMAIMMANYARWGIFATTDQEAPGYTAAKRALMSIKPEHPKRFCSVTREMWEKAYDISPAFNELRPFLNGPMGNGECTHTESLGLPKGQLGDWFFWMLRYGAAAARHYTSSRDSEAFYYRIADEINSAAAAGRVQTRWVFTTSLDPCLDNWLPFLIPTFSDVWSVCWANLNSTDPPDPPGTPLQVLETFNDVACRRSVETGPTVQSQVRAWIWQTRHRFGERALADAGLVLVAVLLLRRAVPGWGAYALTAGALGFIGFSRLGFLTLVWASNFTAPEIRYMLPAALMLTIMSVWLLAEGTRLLASAVASSVSAAPGQAPSATGPCRWPPPGRRTTVAVLALTAAAILVVDLRLLSKPVVDVNGGGTEVRDPDEISDAHLVDLGFQQLQRLDLGNTAVGDGGLKQVARLPQLQWLSLGSTKVGDAGLKNLGPLEQLEWLDLGHTRVTDAGLKELAALKKLKELHLYDTAVSDAGLKDLARLKQLEQLDLKGTKVSAAGVQELRQALPKCQVEADVRTPAHPPLAVPGAVIERDKEQPDQPVVAVGLASTGIQDADLKKLAGFKQLQKLDLGNTSIGDAGLKELAGLRHLRTLSLGFTQVSDAGLKEVAGLTRLEWLDLGHTRITDAGLKELAALAKLKELHLYETVVSNAGLKHLVSLRQLERLDLKGTKVTDAGVKELQRALPKCQVER
jgi:hypothetical protein